MPIVSSIGDFPSYNDLPIIGVSNGALARVTNDAGRGPYTFVASVDTYTTNMWIPSWIAARITGYVQDASNNPLRISTGIGSDNISTVTGRGWTPTIAGGGTIVDSGGNIRFDSGTGSGNVAYLSFTHAFNTGLHLMVLEIDPLIAYFNYSLALVHYDGTKAMMFSLCTDNSAVDSSHPGATVGQCRFHGGATYYLAIGDGFFTINAFDRIFVLFQMGNVANSSGLAQGWKPQDGYQPRQGLSDTSALYTEFYSSALGPFIVYCDAWNGQQARMDVREVHLFEVA